MDYFLKADSEATLKAALVEAGILTESVQPVYEMQPIDKVRVVTLKWLNDPDYSLQLKEPTADHIENLVADGYQVVTDEIVDGYEKPVQVGERVVYAVSGNVVLDIIGQISKPTGNVQTVDGVEVPEMAPIDGFHANLRGDLSDEQLQVLADIRLEHTPTNPYRVWA